MAQTTQGKNNRNLEETEDFFLSQSTILKLQKEAKSSSEVFEQLCIESIARMWLKIHFIPSWRNPKTPIENELHPTIHRYSILLSDGSRFLVKSHSNVFPSLDKLAAAKCFAVLFVQFNPTNYSGRIINCLFTKDVKENSTYVKTNLKPNSTFLDALEVPHNYLLKAIAFSLKLLIFGEPDAPESGTDGVVIFSNTNSKFLED